MYWIHRILVWDIKYIVINNIFSKTFLALPFGRKLSNLVFFNLPKTLGAGHDHGGSKHRSAFAAMKECKNKWLFSRNYQALKLKNTMY